MKFSERFPGIQISLDVQSSEEILHKLKQHTLDIAVCAGPISTASFFVEPFLRDALVLVVPPKHRLAKKEHVTLKDLSNEKLILRSQGSNTRFTIERHFQQHQMKLPPTIELNSTEAIKQAVISGAGISFLSKRTIELEVKCGAIVVIDGEELRPSRQFHIVHPKGIYPSPAILMFTSYLKKVAV